MTESLVFLQNLGQSYIQTLLHRTVKSLFWQSASFGFTYFFVGFSDSCAPFEQFRLKMRLDNLFDYVLVTTIAKAI